MKEDKSEMKPASSSDARENQMIALAIKLAEKQLIDGTASAQVITHYLKLGSSKEKLEKELMEKQKALVDAKTQNLQSSKQTEELYRKALDAMRSYRSTE